MLATLIENAQLVRPGHWSRAGSILIKDSVIKAIDPKADQIDSSVVRVDAMGALLTPGLVDIHCHGIHQYLYEANHQEGNLFARTC
ncbi:dihydroorotase [Adhaeretor mobilis]|uniref:Dihydroorotase n=1 Tax=Adhaeretor mobilis TaxID=1930276 RepID=A0A517MZQ3_9BACT|nr:dihydroorotase [Adhaeretor mobilis]